MAEIPMSGQGVSPESPRTIGPLINMLGAVASLALVAGTCVWGYKLLVRDVSGVPVVKAVEGPMRIQPDDPGGRQAAHQGLSVNSVAADGSAAAPADRLTLAPAPIDLGEETPTVQPANLPQADSSTVEAARNSDTSDIVAPPPLDSSKIEAIEALADQIAAQSTPLEDPAEATTPEPVTASVAVDEPEAAPVAEAAPTPQTVTFTNGVSHSLRPQLRPDGLGSSERVAALDPEQGPPTVVDAASIPAGTHLVQLGAYASAEIATEEWDKMTARFGDYLGDKSRVIQEAQSGGRKFYRLRAMGFTDLSDARRLCSALKAENADCIPVTVR